MARDDRIPGKRKGSSRLFGANEKDWELGTPRVSPPVCRPPIRPGCGRGSFGKTREAAPAHRIHPDAQENQVGGPEIVSLGPEMISRAPEMISWAPEIISHGPKTISGAPKMILRGAESFQRRQKRLLDVLKTILTRRRKRPPAPAHSHVVAEEPFERGNHSGSGPESRIGPPSPRRTPFSETRSLPMPFGSGLRFYAARCTGPILLGSPPLRSIVG